MAKELPNLKDVSRVPEELVPVVQWWQDRGPKTVTIVAVVLAVCGLAVYLWGRAERSADTAAIALPASETADAFLRVADLGTDAAPLARLDLARAYYSAGDFEEALKVYDAALDALSGEPALRDIAVVGRVCALEALGRTDEALAAVAEAEPAIIGTEPVHYLAGELILAKARLLCAKGDKPAAKAALALLTGAAETDILGRYKGRAERIVRIIDAYTGEKGLFELAGASATPGTPVAEPAPAAEQPAAPATAQ